MASTPPLAGPGPDMGAAGAGVLGEPVGRRRSRLRTYLLVEAAAVALGYGVVVLREGAPASGGTWALVVAGAVAVAVPLWVKSRRELRQEAEARSAETLAIETDARLRLIVGDVVTPIAEVVGRVHQTAGKGERESLRGQLKQLVVEAAASLCDGERARAVFFQLERGEMRAAAWFGRGDPPTTVFTDAPGDRRGQEALLLVRFHDYLLIDDVRAEELPRGAEPRPGAGYRSFISVSVFCGDQNLGMLSVDAPEPHAFDETDLNVMRAMAQLLGAGLVDHR
jgi:GAF domain-containing protein